MSKSAKLAWTAMGLTVVAFDVAVALMVAPVAAHAIRARNPQVIASAARHTARHAAAVLGRQAGRMAGDGLTRVARGASRLYETMLRVTPAAAAVEVDLGGCRGAVAPAALKAAPSGCSRLIRRIVVEAATPRSARYYSQTL